MVYWLALPCLLFYKMSFGGQNDLPWLGLGIAAVLFGVSVALALWTGRHLDPGVRGSLANMSYRANGAFVGLPVAVLLIHNGICEPAFEQYFLIMLAGTVPLFNLYSVIAFLLPHHGIDKRAMKRVIIGLLKNPLIWSCVTGIIFAKLGWGEAIGKENVIKKSIALLGEAAIPMALVMAGANLRLESVRSGGGHFWFWTAWKMLFLPAVIIGVCLLFRVDHYTLMALTVLCASPCAVAAVPMAQELGGDEELTATSIVITTIISPISLVAFILIAQTLSHA